MFKSLLFIISLGCLAASLALASLPATRQRMKLLYGFTTAIGLFLLGFSLFDHHPG